MSAGTAAHATVITVEDVAEVAVGAEFVLTVRVSCPAGCDLSGIPIEVMTPDDATATVRAPDPPPHAGAADIAVARRIALNAPLRVGEHVWRLACAAHKSSGWHHDASLLRVPVRVRPHETSLAVWAIPSPVVTSRPFAIKVGAKSAAGCDLTGVPIAVRDAAGTKLAGGVLGDTPWPGTSSLYWTELPLMAPAAAGMFSWSVELAAADLAVPHQGSSSRFSIAIVDPPEHKLTIKVVAQETASPVENAHVRLGAYRATTDGAGFAQLMVPKGAYDLNVWKSGYEAPTASVVIDADRTVEIAITPMPEENPDSAWQM
jgi:Carboxypeptidase regulatory-like domain